LLEVGLWIALRKPAWNTSLGEVEKILPSGQSGPRNPCHVWQGFLSPHCSTAFGLGNACCIMGPAAARGGIEGLKGLKAHGWDATRRLY